MKRIIIIGGGPAGMMAAISAKKHNMNDEVILLEKNPELGRKLKLTGGGRCNVTANVDNNEVIKNVPKNGKFLFSTLSNFNTSDIIAFFNENGCELKEEDHSRMFPITNKAQDIVSTLENVMRKSGVIIKFNSPVLKIDNSKVYLEGETLKYDYLIIATGGITLPQTGSSGDGHNFATNFGHTISNLVPAEVPLVSNEAFIQEKTLQGLSFKDVTLNVLRENGKVKRSITHDFLFTHFGISGPASLRASFDVLNELEKRDSVDILIDFIPNVNINNLLNSKEDIVKELKDNNIPERLINYLKEKNNDDRELIIHDIKAFKVNVYTTRGFKNAFVTNGGINISEINPKTLKSKINERISFCGETIDISAYTGGFNITSALSTGYTAGMYVKEY